jgi:raffinose/stachyose/melibiose transport system permease protein
MLAYVLGRWNFPGRGLLTAYFMIGLLLPLRLGAVPIFFLLRSFGLIDSRLGLILVYAAGGIPFAVFILTAFFRQLPDELEDAARIDGAGEFRLFWSVMLPLVKPALVTIAAVNFVVNWNDFFFPLILLRSESKYTMTVGLTAFMGQYLNDFGTLFAGLIIAMVPLILVFVFASRQIVEGLTSGLGK